MNTFTANEARQFTIFSILENKRDEINKIMNLISEQTRNGKFSIVINDVSEEVFNYLHNNLGYYTIKDNNGYHISWG